MRNINLENVFGSDRGLYQKYSAKYFSGIGDGNARELFPYNYTKKSSVE